MAKHLARLGWDVTVVSPRPQLWRHLDGTGTDIKEAGIEQILTGHSWRCLCPSELKCGDRGISWLLGGMCRTLARRLGIDGGIGWITPAKRACLKLLRPEDTDLIFVSGPPFMTFLLAERLSRALRCPYVLDYRDPWEIPGMMQALRATTTRIERWLLNRAAAVTIVSDSWAADLNSRYELGHKLQVITNGYDSEELANVVPHDFGHFAIVYAGIFYPPDRVITPMLAALKQVKTNGGPRDWYFHYYGNNDSHVREESVRLGIADHVILHGRVPRSEALSAIKGANLALVIGSVSDQASPRVKGWVPAKLFEIVGLNTPVLLIAPPGCDVESIGEATGLTRRFSGSDVAGIAAFIEQVMSGTCAFKKKDVDFITWNHIASRLDGVLREQLVRREPKSGSHRTEFARACDQAE